MLATEDAPAANLLALSGAGETLLLALQHRADRPSPDTSPDTSGDTSGETSGDTSGVVQRRYRSHHSHAGGFRHGENLVPLCQALLEEAGLQPAGLEAVAVDLGPGSFTGQRIALSFAKGLSFALDKPLLGFSSFALWYRPHDAPLLIVIDGRKRRFYAALYLRSGSSFGNRGEELVGTWDLSSAALLRAVSAELGELAQLRLSGPGAELLLQELQEGGAVPAGGLATQSWNETELAERMLALAQQGYVAQDWMRPSDGPLYLRQSDAEEQLKR